MSENFQVPERTLDTIDLLEPRFDPRLLSKDLQSIVRMRDESPRVLSDAQLMRVESLLHTLQAADTLHTHMEPEKEPIGTALETNLPLVPGYGPFVKYRMRVFDGRGFIEDSNFHFLPGCRILLDSEALCDFVDEEMSDFGIDFALSLPLVESMVNVLHAYGLRNHKRPEPFVWGQILTPDAYLSVVQNFSRRKFDPALDPKIQCVPHQDRLLEDSGRGHIYMCGMTDFVAYTQMAHRTWLIKDLEKK